MKKNEEKKDLDLARPMVSEIIAVDPSVDVGKINGEEEGRLCLGDELKLSVSMDEEFGGGKNDETVQPCVLQPFYWQVTDHQFGKEWTHIFKNFFPVKIYTNTNNSEAN